MQCFKKLILIFLLNLTGICLCKQTSENYIYFENLNRERIQTKIDFYKKIENKAKLFRTLTYISGAITATTMVGFTGYTICKWVTEDKKNTGNYENRFSAKHINNTINNTTEYRDKYYYRLLYKNRSFRELLKDGFAFGATDGLYWAITSIFVTTGMAVTAGCYNVTKNKFLDCWYGKNGEFLTKFKDQLYFDLKQFNSFLIPDFYDKKEMAIYYKNFIYTMEHFIALISVLVEINPEQFRQKEVILAGQDLLIERVNNFSQNLEEKLLEEKLNDKLEPQLAKEICDSFDQLGNQIIRFVNLCC
ncbi:hypothetical protein K9L05_03415 [Candidatus Babeliales bacterium]|nr:hypothetical protein [Candidatus Babeliales bacterium]